MYEVKTWIVETENGELDLVLYSDGSIIFDIVEEFTINFPLKETEAYKLIRALGELLQKRQHMIKIK